MKKKDIQQKFGLSFHTQALELSADHLALVKDRKSRIIMKDGERILQQAETVWKSYPEMKVSLMTSAPVCSKTLAFLNARGIDVLPL